MGVIIYPFSLCIEKRVVSQDRDFALQVDLCVGFSWYFGCLLLSFGLSTMPSPTSTNIQFPFLERCFFLFCV
eukprot:NODE_4895_length_618_cov_98.692443_g4213_i0.p2 GENE.NODE_4895_length_618_cov_98.692443_g4213_i0~~NODE_4895_length_618_cov_98.692443_g4213_i0.p2  ORF type:complete len:72 (+),score=5.11 NODE_4895_length_618_cov_98.692443_g4213_i0:224-439(+)